jgi:UDP-glucose:(glucosyl)LPS alpha-1,2-glucosyltransferase
MTDNFDLIKLNELNHKSNGGTELLLRRLYDGKVPRDLLEKVQIIPSRIREMEDDKKKIFWAHDLPEDPESALLSDPSFRKKFAKFVFVSNWQLQRYVQVRGLKYSESTVIRNTIDPFPNRTTWQKDGRIRIIYHSTPHRGLRILVPVFDSLWKEFPDIRLDVYSSFNLYGWPDRDQEYADVFKICEEHPAINYYGTATNEEVRDAIKESDIFAYPSIWMETSCLCLIEAMSAGLLCVHPNLAALPETSMGLTWMYDWSENHNEHAQTFYNVLKHAILTHTNGSEELKNTLLWQQIQANRVYGWNKKHNNWTTLLRSILGQVPHETNIHKDGDKSGTDSPIDGTQDDREGAGPDAGGSRTDSIQTPGSTPPE